MPTDMSKYKRPVKGKDAEVEEDVMSLLDIEDLEDEGVVPEGEMPTEGEVSQDDMSMEGEGPMDFSVLSDEEIAMVLEEAKRRGLLK